MTGFASSFYMIANDLLEVECLIRGDRHDLTNVYQWLRIVLNPPGMKGCQPSRSWVYKIRVDEKLANDFFSILTMVGRYPFLLRKDDVPCVILEACLGSWEFKRRIERERCQI